MQYRTKCLFMFLALCLAITPLRVVAQEGWKSNEDESKVRPYSLPEPLVNADGTSVRTPEEWESRRMELLKMFSCEMYGFMPGVDRSRLKFEELRSNPGALSGKATLKEVRIYFDAPNPRPKLDLLVYVPNDPDTRPASAFVCLNFKGNHTVSEDPWITPSDNPEATRTKGLDEEKQRGAARSRWPVERIIERGYALVTGFYEDIDPDFDDQRQNGVHPLFAPFEKDLAEGEKAATITAWAWGYSRILDCLETMPEIDSRRVAVMGHSRLGKTALWAGANDPRFALVISNDSGCGGAALSRRNFGEEPIRITHTFPHWFCPNFLKYVDDPSTLPFDQHELVALIAPRPVYVASADQDRWADPKGEFLSAWNADPVYRLLGTEGIGGVSDNPPAPNCPVGADIHYHRRDGIHDVTLYDWERYMDFADRYLKNSF